MYNVRRGKTKHVQYMYVLFLQGGWYMANSLGIDMSHVRKIQHKQFRKKVFQAWQLYLLLLVPVVYVIIFNYVPMYGVTIAFKDYNIKEGILGSPWIGLVNFKRFIVSYAFERVIFNTIILSFYGLIAGFPVPIILALGINYMNKLYMKKSVQMITYAPYFLSTVIMVGLLTQILSVRFGVANRLIMMLGGEAVNFMGFADYFRHVYVWSGVWQGAGYGSIIYIAALAGVDPQLHEAAIIDGANIWQRILYIDLPSIAPTIIILFIMRMGRILNIGFEKAFLMQTALNNSKSEVISTYVYKVGLASSMPDFSFATAIGLFQNVIGLMLLISVNWLSRRVSETSMW